jgi:hypothetical protein
MCKWGTVVPVRVRIAPKLSSTGKEKWKVMGIDARIAPIVKALQRGGIDMLSSCCGHDKGPGEIILRDHGQRVHRVLEIHPWPIKLEALRYRDEGEKP